MKRPLLILLFLSPFLASAQPAMTIAEVYDYNVGDVFVRVHQANSGPPNTVQTTITNKYYSTTLDTVYYVYDSHSYAPPACPPPCQPTINNTAGQVMFYTHLSDTIGAGLGTPPNYLSGNCIDTTGFNGFWFDSTYSNSQLCNTLTTRIEWLENYYYQDSCVMCFECFYGLRDYGKGVGETYYTYNDCADASNFPCYFTTRLTWFKKGNDSCGTYPIILGTDFLGEDKLSFHISPNPAHDKLNVECNLPNAELKIYDMMGRVVMEEKLRSQLSTFNFQLRAGMYVVRVASCTSAAMVQKLIIE